MRISSGRASSTCAAHGGSGEAGRRLLGRCRAALGLRTEGAPSGGRRFPRRFHPGGDLAFDHRRAAVDLAGPETPRADGNPAAEGDCRPAKGERRALSSGNDAGPCQARRTDWRASGSFSATRERRTPRSSRLVVTTPDKRGRLPSGAPATVCYRRRTRLPSARSAGGSSTTVSPAWTPEATSTPPAPLPPTAT